MKQVTEGLQSIYIVQPGLSQGPSFSEVDTFSNLVLSAKRRVFFHERFVKSDKNPETFSLSSVCERGAVQQPCASF